MLLPMKDRSNKYLQGFTIVEVLFAIIIFVVAILSVLTAFPTQFRSVQGSTQNTVTTNLAQAKIEELIGKENGYDLLTVGTQPVANFTTAPFTNYQYQVSVVLLDSNLQVTQTDVGIKRVTVDVFYTEGGDQRKSEVASLITKH